MKSTKIIKNILNLLLPYKKRLILAAFSLLTVVSCLLTIGYVIKNFVDTSLDPASNAIKELIALIIIFGAASFIRSYIINSTAEFAANDLKISAFKNILNSRPDGMDGYDFSDISTRINQDSEYISRVVIDITSFFIRNTMTTIGGIILMFTNSHKLSLIAFSSIGVITILASLLSKKIRNLAKQAENAKSVTSNLVLESIINRKVVSSFSAENKLYNYFLKLNGDSMSKIVTRLRFRSIFFASVITSMLLTISTIVWLGSIEVQQGNMSAGVLASFLFYSFMTALSFGGIMEMISELEKNLANCERIFELIDISAEEKYDIIKLEPNSKIALKNISYYFSNHQNSFSLENLKT